MDVRAVIAAAKAYAGEIFDGEEIADLGVEEVVKEGDVWRITLGLSRPWANSVLKTVFDPRTSSRTYHVFSVSDETGQVSDVRLRERA